MTVAVAVSVVGSMIAGVREPGWDWAISDGDGVGCPRCGVAGTQRTRRRLTRRPLLWLRGSGPLVPHGVECSACGYRWPGRLGVFWGRPPAPRWLLPWHVVRAVVVAVRDQRTVHPVPLHHLASAGLGAGLGGVLGARRGRVGGGVVLGAVTGLATSWSAFTAPTLVRYGTGTAVADAVLALVGDPQRNAERCARRHEDEAAGAGFAPYGLEAAWEGHRSLDGCGTSWATGRRRPRVVELVLRHSTGSAAPGAPGWDEGITVSTRAPRDLSEDHCWQLTEAELADSAARQLTSWRDDGSAVERRAVVVLLDGTAVEATALEGDDERWVVVVRTSYTYLEVRGRGEVPRELRLERVHDLSRYPSALRPVAQGDSTPAAVPEGDSDEHRP